MQAVWMAMLRSLCLQGVMAQLIILVMSWVLLMASCHELSESSAHAGTVFLHLCQSAKLLVLNETVAMIGHGPWPCV